MNLCGFGETLASKLQKVHSAYLSITINFSESRQGFENVKVFKKLAILSYFAHQLVIGG
jgi:hypothetical protein